MNDREVMKLALEALENSKRTHYYCEDTWYSCPKHEEGCANEWQGNECNCGADKVNVQIESAITALRTVLVAAEKDKEIKRLQDLLYTQLGELTALRAEKQMRGHIKELQEQPR